MSILYPKFFYLWPPRPKTTIKPNTTHFEAMKGRKRWIAQLKLNGQRNVIFISPDGDIEFWNRRNGPHLNYTAPQWLIDEIREVVPADKGWTVLDGELLHMKDASIKNTLYWWDVLVYDGEYLVGETYEARHRLLGETVVTSPISHDGAIAKLTDSIWLAENIAPDQYDEMWKRTETSYVEGFVFKNLVGKLRPCIGESNNNEWQVRCRKPHGGYQF